MKLMVLKILKIIVLKKKVDRLALFIPDCSADSADGVLLEEVNRQVLIYTETTRGDRNCSRNSRTKSGSCGTGVYIGVVVL